MGPSDHFGQVLACCSFLYECGITHHSFRCRCVSVNAITATDSANFDSMLLPFPVLLKSHIQNRKKFALIGLLALGTFITVIQVIRIQTVKSLANYLDSASLIMWSTVENNLGIIVASIPTLAPLFKYYAEKSQKSSTGRSASGSRSLYALKSLRSARQSSMPLGSGVEHKTHINGPSEGESAEFILGDAGVITKRTEVTVSSHTRKGSEASEDCPAGMAS
jgi:hypothetical protein